MSKDQTKRTKHRVMAWLAGVCGFCAVSEQSQAVDPILLRSGRHRIEPLCSVPREDYQFGSRTQSLVVRSLAAAPHYSSETTEQKIAAFKRLASASDLSATPSLVMPPINLIDPTVRPDSKLLQLANQTLEIAHCEMSDIALKVEPNGSWYLSLRADQNRVSKNDEQTRSDDIQIKRNAFRLNVRLLSSAHRHQENIAPEINQQIIGAQSGKIAVAHLVVPEFWVQREAPNMVSRKGFDPMIAQHFDEIDEAEFEFFVLLDPLTGSGKGVVLPWQRKIGWNAR